MPFLAQILLRFNDFTGQDFVCEGEMVVGGSPAALHLKDQHLEILCSVWWPLQ